MVLSVLAIVSAVSFSYYGEYIEDARKTVRKTNEKLINEAINRYYKENMSYPIYHWLQDSFEGIDKKVNYGLDYALSGYFVNKKVSEILSEGAGAGGNVIYYRVSETLKKDGSLGNLDNSFNPGTWKLAENLRIVHKEYLVHEVRIAESDEATAINSFNDGERFNFPLVDNSVPISDNAVGKELVAENEDLELKMVCCPAGTFLMGAVPGEIGEKTNENKHQVTLTKSFLIGRYEITQKQYKKVMGNNPSSRKATNPNFPEETDPDLLPVENVGLNSAKAFCSRLNESYSRLIPAGYQFDLPTEAQWEYACRAGTTTSLNNNLNISRKTGKCDNLGMVGWYKANASNTTHIVGLKVPNAWGIYDMHGNVEELIKDLRNVVGSTYPGYPGDEVDPCVTTGNQQCHRGGCFSTEPERTRSASRQGSQLDKKLSNVGFRVVLTKIDD